MREWPEWVTQEQRDWLEETLKGVRPEDEIEQDGDFVMGDLYPDACLVDSVSDYRSMKLSIDTRRNAAVIRFEEGATIRVGHRQLRLMIHMLQACLECLEREGIRDEARG